MTPTLDNLTDNPSAGDGFTRLLQDALSGAGLGSFLLLPILGVLAWGAYRGLSDALQAAQGGRYGEVSLAGGAGLVCAAVAGLLLSF